MGRFAFQFALLALFCLLVAQTNVVNGECCHESKIVEYRVLNGLCGEVNGIKSDDGDCIIQICADGRPLRGSYCGRRSCNAFGCYCDGGCLSGNWEHVLHEKTAKTVEILGVSWQDLSLFRMPDRSFWDMIMSLFTG